ncbi:MAG: hypothetical protein HN590_16830 [Calditrichaeota bacterium]|nr:hypothetical protein [Calditrichota bacterium]
MTRWIISALIVCLISGMAFEIDGSNKPRSKQGTLIESANPMELMVSAGGTGIWEKGDSKSRDRENYLLKSAEDDARRTAVYFVILGGTTPLLTQAEEKLAFSEIQEPFFELENLRKFITWEGTELLKRTKREIKKKKKYELLIEKAFKVNREAIQEVLVARGVMKAGLVDEMGLPNIMVLPEVKKGKNPIDVLQSDPKLQHSATVIKEYLATKKYDVVLPEQMSTIADISAAQQSLGDVEEDYSYQLALSIGSDIYITFKTNVADDKFGTKKAIVNVNAYETTTSRLLGSATGYSPSTTDPELVLIENAVADGIDKVLSLVTAYWKEDIRNGLQYKVIVSISTDFDKDEVTDIQDVFAEILDQITKNERYKEVVATDQTLDYLIWVDNEKYAKPSKLARKFRKVFEQEYSDGVLREVNRTGKLLMFKVEME